MYKVSVSVLKNRLYLFAEGRMGVEEVDVAIGEINDEVEKLAVGFNVISSLSSFEPEDDVVRLKFQRAIKALKEEKGLGNLIRVIPGQQGVSECNALEVIDCQWLKDFRKEGKIAEDVSTLEMADARMDALDLNCVYFG